MSASAKKIVVITGATRGLGRALVEGLVQQGCIVAGCGRTESKVRELTQKFGDPHRFAVVDVADDESVKQWAGESLTALGPPALLLNNAALINQNAPLWKVSAAEFGAVIDVNIKGVANVIRHFAPAMIARQAGVIVNWSSGWGRSTAPDVAPYCATKWAIEGLSQALAQELPAGMACIALNPGIINTEMLQSCFGGSASSFPSPERWAKSAVPFLLKLGPKDNGKSLTAPG